MYFTGLAKDTNIYNQAQAYTKATTLVFCTVFNTGLHAVMGRPVGGSLTGRQHRPGEL